MARRRKESRPTEAERLRWRAEEIVRQAVEKVPNYNEAIKSTVAELRRLDKEARQKLAGKKERK